MRQAGEGPSGLTHPPKRQSLHSRTPGRSRPVAGQGFARPPRGGLRSSPPPRPEPSGPAMRSAAKWALGGRQRPGHPFPLNSRRPMRWSRTIPPHACQGFMPPRVRAASGLGAFRAALARADIAGGNPRPGSSDTLARAYASQNSRAVLPGPFPSRPGAGVQATARG
jgi:hypothetical protein